MAEFASKGVAGSGLGLGIAVASWREYVPCLASGGYPHR